MAACRSTIIAIMSLTHWSHALVKYLVLLVALLSIKGSLVHRYMLNLTVVRYVQIQLKNILRRFHLLRHLVLLPFTPDNIENSGTISLDCDEEIFTIFCYSSIWEAASWTAPNGSIDRWSVIEFHAADHQNRNFINILRIEKIKP